MDPLRNCFQGEARNGREFDARRMPPIVERDGCHERDFVLETALGHRLYQRVVDEQSGWIAHRQLALQSQRGQPGLRLTDQVNRQEPHRRPKLGSLKSRSCDERHLVTTRAELKDLAQASTQNAVCHFAAARTEKVIRPTRLLRHCRTLRLATVLCEEIRHRQPRLKLDSIHRHNSVFPDVQDCRLRPARLTTRAWLNIVTNQELNWFQRGIAW